MDCTIGSGDCGVIGDGVELEKGAVEDFSCQHYGGVVKCRCDARH